MKYNMHDAKTNFSKLVAAVESGEQVTVCRNGEPVIDFVLSKHKSAPYPFGVWAKDKHVGTSLDYMVDPTDDALLDDMGL